MIRAFIALPLPETLRSRLLVTQFLLPGGRAVERDNLHLTLAFLGEQPENRLDEVHAALSVISAPPLQLQIDGLGVFGGDKPRLVYAAPAADTALMRLQARVARAVETAGVVLPHRRFVPHITLRRYAPGEGSAPALAQAIGQIGRLDPASFAVDEFCLMRSRLLASGPAYDALAHYPLTR